MSDAISIIKTMPRLLALLFVLCSLGAAHAQPRAETPRGPLAEDERANIAIFRNVSPSVVNITTLANQRNLFSLDVLQVPKGTGSGIVWDERGLIVTNFHVIQGASAARVTLSDQSEWTASLVGAFPDRDLAVLRIEAPREKLKAIAIGASRDLMVGQRVYAIGNPFGLDHTMTVGIISALNREIQTVNQRTIRGVIQTDAAINPGNSSSGPPGRRQHRDLQSVGRLGRHRFCDPGRRSQPHRAAPHPRRQDHAPRFRHPGRVAAGTGRAAPAERHCRCRRGGAQSGGSGRHQTLSARTEGRDHCRRRHRCDGQQAGRHRR